MANNNALFNAAIAGIGGAIEQRWITGSSPINYVRYQAALDAFATAVDAAIPAGSPSTSDAELLQSICMGILANRDIVSVLTTDYNTIAVSIAALYTELQSLLLPVGGAGAVLSVFGRVGAVVAALNDYLASQVDNDSGVAGATVADALDTLALSSAPVSSVFGRVGAVVAALNDYLASQVDNDSGVTGATVATALDTLAASIAALITGVSSVYGRTGAVVAATNDYTSTQVSNASGVAGTGVTGALDTLAASIAALITGVSSVYGRTGAVVAATNDYTSTQVSNASGVAGTGVTGALDTLNALRPQVYTWWASAAPAVNADRFVVANNITAVQGTEVQATCYVVPVACNAIALVFNNSNTALATDTVTVTLRVAANGGTAFADTALTFVIPAGTTAGTMVGDVAHTVALNAGDRLGIKVRQNGATAQANWFAAFTLYCR